MSADNGIYILPIIIENGNFNTEIGTHFPREWPIVWRVIETGGIDNITFAPDEGEYNSEQLEHYFGDAPEFNNEQEAILYAHDEAKKCVVLEYGVVVTLPQTSHQFKNNTSDPSRIYKFDGGVDEGTLWLANKNGDNIAKVVRLKPDQTVELKDLHEYIISDEEWQKIVDTIVLAPELIELAIKMNQGIINTEDNRMCDLIKKLGEQI